VAKKGGFFRLGLCCNRIRWQSFWNQQAADYKAMLKYILSARGLSAQSTFISKSLSFYLPRVKSKQTVLLTKVIFRSAGKKVKTKTGLTLFLC
jgi:hypothetical protein